MATKVECKTCREHLGEGPPSRLSSPQEERESPAGGARIEEERELLECNLEMRVGVYISIYM